KITPDNAAEVMNGIGQEASASLYNGNWIPVTFTKGKYAGASVVFSTFWNKTDQYPTDQSTDNFPWSNFGWANLYTGIIPNEVTSASSIIEALYPENPVMPQTAPANLPSYSVALNQFVPQKFNEGFPWVQDLTITIKANTKLRYALAAYANDLSKSEGGVTAVDDPTQDLVITVSAISPVTQNTLFSDQISQYYEGAAVPEIDGQAVGYAGMEHMGKN
ncbi:MAG: hypothetical protein NTU49_01055, partial [Gammaproteobacteria bacterium]|nr:hypothetical protein [Gammaproteobacteria bacterium]